MDDLERVVRYCRRWGVSLCTSLDVVPPMRHAEWSPGPIFGGIWWRTATIWFPLTGVVPSDLRAPCALLHELAHCLQRTRPGDVDEQRSGILAFEDASTRWLRMGRAWKRWMAGYGLKMPSGESEEWRTAPRATKRSVLRASCRRAVARGLLTPEGRPTFRLPSDVVARRLRGSLGGHPDLPNVARRG